jgi:TonB-linked SusC/RagA family outer membrane protein
MEITITKRRQKPGWLLFFLFILIGHLQGLAQQNVTVTGSVTDETGRTIPGASVRVKGTKTGTVTDMQGHFSLPIADGKGVLTISYLGYITQDIPLNGQNTVNVQLVGDPKSLKEVVVIGYGSQKRETVTDAISTVKAEDFNKGNITDPITLIQGKVAGLSISRSGGSDPNAMADFQLRGPSSVFSENGPLIVIDGVPGGDIQMVAPQDIASMDVLKDASASSIYGERGSSGVIIVTTKKGKPGTSTITYDGNLSTELVAKKYDVLNASQYIALGKKYDMANNLNQKANTDWFNEVTRTPLSHSHNLSLSGGTDKTTYYAAVSYRNLEGLDLVDKREFVQGTARLNTKALNDKLSFTVGLTNSFDNKSFANTGAISQTLNMNPTYPVRNPDGSFFQQPGQYNLEWNPVANELQNHNDAIEKRFQGIADLSYKIIPGLVADVNYNTRREDYLNSTYSDNDDFFQQLNGLNGTASRTELNIMDNVFQSTLNYSKDIGKHHFDIIGGYSYQDTFNDGFGAGNNYFSSNAYLYYNLGAGSALNTTDPAINRSGVYENTATQDRYLASYFGRVIYDYDEKYLFKASIRRDGSSVLAPGYKWGNYYGISAGWVLSKESFLEDNKIFKFLKVRTSYGTTGNDQALSAYQSLFLLGPLTTPYIEDGSIQLPQNGYVGDGVNGSWIIPYAPTNNTNQTLKFELQKQFDAGIDFALFNDSWLTGTVDYYNKTISDLLVPGLPAQVPSYIFPTISANAGSYRDRGVELMLNGKLVKDRNFSWNATFTGSYNENKVLSLSSDLYQGSAINYTNLNGSDLIQRLVPGKPLDEFYGKVFAGFDKDGNFLFKNAEGKSVLGTDINPETDYKYLGSGLPKVNLSLTNSFRYKNFDLSFLLRSALGFKAVNAKRLQHENIHNYVTSNLFTSVENSSTLIKDNEYFSSYYIENGAYLKLDNVNIGYSVPMKPNSAIKSLRISFTAINVFTITGFSGIDPELPLTTRIDSQIEGLSNPGVEPRYTYYPATRTLTMGLTATF